MRELKCFRCLEVFVETWIRVFDGACINLLGGAIIDECSSLPLMVVFILSNTLKV